MNSNLRDRFTSRQNTVYLRQSDFRGHDRGITVYNVTVEKILPILIEALKTAGYEGSWRIEEPPLTTQFLATVKRFDPVSLPKCHKCKQPLKIGNKVVSIKTEGRPKIYHEDCCSMTLH
jgi:hypothetical protein